MSDLTRKTPLMGWASWNCFNNTRINEAVMREQADALVETGLAECGYTYLNLDDGFFGGRGPDGRLRFHPQRFPNGIKPVADYAHSRGLRAGIYSDGGHNTCCYCYGGEGTNGEGVGLYGHEEQDLRMYFQEFGFDFIKVDWCGGVRLALDEEEQYSKIGRIIDGLRRETGRPLVYNVCRWQFPGPWVTGVADSWRIGGDITPDFNSVLYELDMAKPLARYCSPGHVNDLDMMQLGNGGLTHDEEMSHFAMWCMASSPLMIGCDLTAMDPETLKILKNRELIAIDQDSACRQAVVVKELRGPGGALLGEVWVKELGSGEPGTRAVALLNRSTEPLTFSIELGEAGLGGRLLAARGIVNARESDIDNGRLTNTLRPHAVAVYMIRVDRTEPLRDLYDQGEVERKPNIKITLEEAEALVREGAALVDAREDWEFARGHLPGAVNLCYMYVGMYAPELFPDKERPLVVYCSSGKRSAQAKLCLEYLGYRNVYFLGGVEL